MYTTEHIGVTNIVLYKGRKCSWLEIYEVRSPMQACHAELCLNLHHVQNRQSKSCLHCPPSAKCEHTCPRSQVLQRHQTNFSLLVGMCFLPAVPLDKSFEKARKLSKHSLGLQHAEEREWMTLVQHGLSGEICYYYRCYFSLHFNFAFYYPVDNFILGRYNVGKEKKFKSHRI